MASDRPERSISVDKSELCLRGQFVAMASPCEVLLEIDDADDALELTRRVAAEAWRIEDKFSRYLPDNSVDRINRANGESIELDSETAQLIDFATTLYDLSGGRFDITSGVLRQIWRFDGSGNIPSRKSVKRILQRVGWDRVEWNSPVLRMQADMEIDLGGIGKEFAVDRAANLLRENTNASCLVNFGGDLVATRKPERRKAWKVGIESATKLRSSADTVLNFQVGGLATSGDARRFLLKDGIRYSHILDPKTGWPIPGAPRSVTVAADTCTQAGMLSTLAMLKGAQAEKFLETQGLRYWCNRE